ncbi:MAG: beta-aspartyl-peptidase [Acidocella sp. 20-61-6]|nr:MAG: beta-aspartyl-peptidase [Acidocella sp. 20-61-6]
MLDTYGGFCLAIHGGAGTVPVAALKGAAAEAYHAALRTALKAGWTVLNQGGPAVDAVAAAVVELENDALFNAARGAVFTSAGQLEMDAAIMNGADRAAGALAGICGPKNPILAARAVMEKSGTVFMIGTAAEAFLRTENIQFMPTDYFVTPRRLEALHLELTRRAAGMPDTRSDADRHGTVGAVARDAAGNVAAGTSTGGMTAKRPGRVGDTPVIGAGTFADNATCAVSTTGTGEVFIRFTAAADIAARIRYAGQNLEQAAGDVIAELSAHGGDGGLIAVGATGAPVLPFNSSGMYRGFVGVDGVLSTAIHREAFRQVCQ